ncbi:uncharacterized protein LOC107029618 isoform X3 [Solanum pennellii]|uniref:Uncharacterized protein LOC107029618 isoform X3 n=1 Tax=Solanum pennellii TaxID=28526 RepID=A0ABM1HJX4_SOLPN|nr:uncharacterized protein LOC107029618 isoform X3 [Solanum pennellii]
MVTNNITDNINIQIPNSTLSQFKIEFQIPNSRSSFTSLLKRNLDHGFFINKWGPLVHCRGSFSGPEKSSSLSCYFGKKRSRTSRCIKKGESSSTFEHSYLFRVVGR